MKTFFRFLWRNKLYTAIEVVGMAVAIAFVIFIAAFIIGELTVDSQLEGKENIYAGRSERMYIGSATLKEQFEGKFPEIESICRLTDTENFGVLGTRINFGEDDIRQDVIVADANFFEMLTFPLVQGTVSEALPSRNSVAVSESFAARYFPDKNPVGQVFTLKIGESEESVAVSSVYKDIRNSVIPSRDIIITFDLLGDMYPDAVDNGNGICVNLFKVSEGADIQSLGKGLEAIAKENDMIYRFDLFHEYRLVPFKDIHFESIEASFPFSGIIEKDFVRIFIAAGVLLLIFAVLNYISLTVAQTGFRAREMALRRLLGTRRSGVIWRYLAEALILTLISFTLALVLAEIFAPAMGSLIGKDVNILSGGSLIYGLFCVGLILLLTVASGIVPALIVSRYSPISVVKGEFARSSRMTLGKTFIVIQNTVAAITLALALVMFLQIRHMTLKPMGYERDGRIAVSGAGNPAEYHIDELRQIAGVTSVGWLQWPPMYASHRGMGLKIGGEERHFDMYACDAEAFTSLGFEIVAQNAAPEAPQLWMTESAMRGLGLSYDCTSLDLDSGSFIPVGGIIKDFTKGTADSSNEFLLCCWLSEMDSPERFMTLRELVVKVEGDENEVMHRIRDFYRDKGYGEDEIEADTYNHLVRFLYSLEDQNLKLIAIFTLLILLLSTLAMVAMSTYYAKQNARQAAIRKVLGCSRAKVWGDTVKGFLTAVVIAVVISTPCAFALAGRWLEGYSYRIGNYIWIYIAVAALLVICAVAAISAQAVRLMNTDPVEALKTE